MTKQTSLIFLLAAVTILAASMAGCCWINKSNRQIVIITQPQSRTVPIGTDVMFSVVAREGTNELTYKWQYNGTILDGDKNWTDLPRATGSNYVINGVQTANRGFYRVLISGSPTTSSAPAELQVVSSPRVESGNTVITVYGTPRATAGSGSCFGKYLGVVKYANGWGVIDLQKPCAAKDAQRTDTSMDSIGLSKGDPHCSNGQGWIGLLPVSTNYDFDVYFTTKPVGTGEYQLYLTNFYCP